MAELRYNFYGPVAILSHADVDDALVILAAGQGVAGLVARVPPLAPVAAVVAGYLTIEAALIKHMDKGNGVYLTMPWATPGLVIPTTRPPDIGLPADWVSQGAGLFTTEDRADLLAWQIVKGAVGADAVEFRLSADDSFMWRKVLVIRDGLGSQWDVAIDPSQGTLSATNGLWAHQVDNGQVCSLWKAKEFGLMFWVLDIAGLQALQPGDRAEFRWLRG
ncbi:hypothetical protein K1W54_12380 [Micromonospora sp. CPCC 205371]|nr:hypothetical protein [Micromonospora sp. CPCC 205371]